MLALPFARELFRFGSLRLNDFAAALDRAFVYLAPKAAKHAFPDVIIAGRAPPV
jgi:hypothetical protein